MKNTLSKISRISWVDICRGIGILLVIYGHFLDNDEQRFLIYAFHMPLFFFLSGIVFNEKFKSFAGFIKKNIKTILIPYFIFAVMSYVVSYVFKNPLDPNSFLTFLGHMKGVIYGNGNDGNLFFNVVLWFLPCLFITKLGFAILTRISLKKTRLAGMLIAISLAGYLGSIFFPLLKLPFGIETAITAIVFFGFGYLWKKTSVLQQLFKNRVFTILFVSTIITVLFATFNYVLYGYQIDMRLNRLNNYTLFYISAFSGIFATLALSIIIEKNKVLEYIGRHSLNLYVWHYVLFTYLNTYITSIISADTIHAIKTLLPTMYTILSVTIILFLTYLWRKIRFVSYTKIT